VLLLDQARGARHGLPATDSPAPAISLPHSARSSASKEANTALTKPQHGSNPVCPTRDCRLVKLRAHWKQREPKSTHSARPYSHGTGIADSRTSMSNDFSPLRP
jgi:hypothetical protein